VSGLKSTGSRFSFQIGFDADGNFIRVVSTLALGLDKQIKLVVPFYYSAQIHAIRRKYVFALICSMAIAKKYLRRKSGGD
jgi:hypothetical protein